LRHEAAVPEHHVEHAADAILLVRLLPRTVDRYAEDVQTGRDERLGALRVERNAEVGADLRRDSAPPGVRDHRHRLAVQERLTPVVQLDLPEVVAQLVEESPVEIARHRTARPSDLTRPREAMRAREVAGTGRLHAELHGIAPQPGLRPERLPR